MTYQQRAEMKILRQLHVIGLREGNLGEALKEAVQHLPDGAILTEIDTNRDGRGVDLHFWFDTLAEAECD